MLPTCSLLIDQYQEINKPDVLFVIIIIHATHFFLFSEQTISFILQMFY